MDTPLVTVILLTFNHINTFEKAINSVLEQKTNFPFQIIVYDDASTDGTSEIVKKYTDIPNVKAVIREENAHGKNLYLALKDVNTKYYAILETDDYWCDENKLQTQVDILENNPDCSFCAHNTLVNYVKTNKTKEYITSRLYRSECLNLDEIKNPIIATYDIAVNFYFFTKGSLYYIDKVMSVYNYTAKGVYSGLSSFEQRYKSASVIHQINDEFDYKYNSLLSRFFLTRLNLNFIIYLILKFSKSKSFLKSYYQKILDTYKKRYLGDWFAKPVAKINIPLSKHKRLVFECRTERERS